MNKAELPHGKRPEPPKIQENLDVTSWFKENDEERTWAAVRDIGWVVARQIEPNNQSVPAWRAYNECSSPVNPPMINIGMLPILQAPADEYDTITTIINRFVSISYHIGQTHTVITADQPLYAKGMELVWANNEKYGNVIFRLGGLHVCFNFLKAIGQHTESAGLEDLWIESGLFPANVTENMLSGKAYDRAVRAHTLTYEALWRLRWVIFRAWIANKGIGYPELEEVDKQTVGTMNTTNKSELMNLFTSDMGIGVPEILADSKHRTCKIIDGHALIQVLGKPAGCVTFGDYADHFLNSVIKDFDENTTRVDVAFDRYLGRSSIKASTRDKRVGKRRPIRKLVSGPEVP